MAWSSTIRIGAELQWRKAKIWSLIEYAKPVRLPILDPSVKHRIAPGKEFGISRKRERYTVAIVEFLGYLHSLKTGRGHGPWWKTGDFGSKQWKWKFLEGVWLSRVSNGKVIQLKVK